jgi:plastocyanin
MRTICALAVAAMALVAVPMAGAATVPVSITKSGFTPSTVTATTADTVQFKNNDTVVHQVAFKPTAGATCSPSPFTLQAGQSGTCTFTPAGSFTFSDPSATGTAFQGTLTVKAPAVPDTLTLFADPQDAAFSNQVHLTGELSSKKAGVDVGVMAKPCGKSTATKAATVQTTANGEFSTDLRAASNTVYTVQVGSTASQEVSIDVAPRLRLGRVAAHRYSLRVFAAQSFAGKWATFQRLKGNRWISVKRVQLQKNSTNILPTVISSVAFRWNSKTRPRVRAILPQGQAGSCYVAGLSNDIRS